MPSPRSIYAPALASLNLTPNRYNAKPQFQLAPDLRAAEALRAMLRFLFSIMRQNEAGILNDIDTEFLHDFRVASRRARSAVGQIKGVFDAATTQRLKKDLASLGSMTNRVRDLDVYLLRHADYRAKLPASHRDAIEPLFDLLRHDRKQAFHRLKRKLRAKSYAELMTRWETFLGAETSGRGSESAPHAARPIRKVARKRLAKLSDRIIKSGRLLLAKQDDRQLHELRIDCKKLRYLLEFTGSIFPKPAVAPVMKHLRKLQDVLGDFQDRCVQQETLATYAEHFAGAEATQQAIVHLIDVLEQEKQACKADFAERFNDFAASVDRKHQPWKRKA
jgi:CHAD domain-containing protein